MRTISPTVFTPLPTTVGVHQRNTNTGVAFRGVAFGSDAEPEGLGTQRQLTPITELETHAVALTGYYRRAQDIARQIHQDFRMNPVLHEPINPNYGRVPYGCLGLQMFPHGPPELLLTPLGAMRIFEGGVKPSNYSKLMRDLHRTLGLVEIAPADHLNNRGAVYAITKDLEDNPLPMFRMRAKAPPRLNDAERQKAVALINRVQPQERRDIF